MNSALVDPTLHDNICNMPSMKYFINVGFFPYLPCHPCLFLSLCSEQPITVNTLEGKKISPLNISLFSLSNFHNFHSKYCLYVFNRSLFFEYPPLIIEWFTFSRVADPAGCSLLKLNMLACFCSMGRGLHQCGHETGVVFCSNSFNSKNNFMAEVKLSMMSSPLGRDVATRILSVWHH